MAFPTQRIRFLLDHQPFWRVMLVLSAVAIMYLATTSEPYPIPSSDNDKLNHVLAFLQLTIVTRLAWPGLSRLWIAPGLLAFGVAIEIVQAQLPYRTFAGADILADAAGIAIGLLPFPDFIRQRVVKSDKKTDVRDTPERL
ncbi:VanZ family protein [Marinobacter sp. ATCH36]|uniref:VanZ family protein n=1 Tax=Marinobacter sp. ATCH36 TaxID=2945106 RepID=UPI002020EFCB|nr:VanZ family protein [Marinobacter sp. ATCH36]MCL7943097.1 VanZ family protein [Marinobacter sp. ATCH36]